MDLFEMLDWALFGAWIPIFWIWLTGGYLLKPGRIRRRLGWPGFISWALFDLCVYLSHYALHPSWWEVYDVASSVVWIVILLDDIMDDDRWKRFRRRLAQGARKVKLAVIRQPDPLPIPT